ncbi:PA3496 family putative envelope integrity protein [Halomonas sp. V046]|uniref:PA3496 family putative envelope integrity protein n=1 Tax=Halomonas sp. V046 TaxID=3459611 RepID=UPI004044C0B4
MSRDTLLDDAYLDLSDQEAVNDEDYSRNSRPTSRADTLRARRRVEALLEERRLQQAIDDGWGDDEEEEEE